MATYTALYLLQQLKSCFPTAHGLSRHRLFLSTFMLASKVICDNTYSNKSWLAQCITVIDTGSSSGSISSSGGILGTSSPVKEIEWERDRDRDRE